MLHKTRNAIAYHVVKLFANRNIKHRPIIPMTKLSNKYIFSIIYEPSSIYLNYFFSPENIVNMVIV